MLKKIFSIYMLVFIYTSFMICEPCCVAFASTPYDFNVTHLGGADAGYGSQPYDSASELQPSVLSEVSTVQMQNEYVNGSTRSQDLTASNDSSASFALSGIASLVRAAYEEKTAQLSQVSEQNIESVGSQEMSQATPIRTEEVSQRPPHILVVAGIQGDEPGGFTAASLLATRYSISYGSVTIVPNLNFLAIINRQRGIYGDMNRKFASLDESDPEYEIVQRIKEMIVSPSIDLVLNLHDGSGFYNPKYISELQNPNRWGNSIIIDQVDFDAPLYGKLEEIATTVAQGVNENLLKDLHAIHVHNTKTAEGNVEMAKSLTWFALGKGKPAFGVEASKNLNVAERTYYHLSMLENFFDYVGIKYHRPFELSPAGIQKALSTDIFIGFEDNRFVVPLNNIRRTQAGSIPLGKDSTCLSNSPIITAVPKNNQITVHYGNNYLTSFKVDLHEVDKSIDRMNVIIDGAELEVPFGTIVHAQDYFAVKSLQGYRVNAIGAVVGNGPRGDESDKKIHLKDFQSRFSLDNAGTVYRVEVYSGVKYVGTFVVQYAKNAGNALLSPLGQ